jgi:hypothetical protein
MDLTPITIFMGQQDEIIPRGCFVGHDHLREAVSGLTNGWTTPITFAWFDQIVLMKHSPPWRLQDFSPPIVGKA